MPPRPRIPALPQLLDRKIYKSGQTRGADDDLIFQNRVGRNSTVIIPHSLWPACRVLDGGASYEKGYVVVVPPSWYFAQGNPGTLLEAEGLELGTNALVFYQLRSDWVRHPPGAMGWTAATSRIAPLGGQYVARIAGTTAADGGGRINDGFTTTSMKGLGIRVYEYAAAQTIADCRTQLEALFWLCRDSLTAIVEAGMPAGDAGIRRAARLAAAGSEGLLDLERLRGNRIVNADGFTVCPLCLAELSALGFVTRLEQAEGREVHDLTVTEVNLFHIDELRVGQLLHRPYNVAWGHHHCNTVARDVGITATLEWMREVLERTDALA